MLESIRNLQKYLQMEKKEKFSRRTSFGDLITDRWENAKGYGFGEGSSCYDNVLIIGTVSVGENTWIGPNVVLDGSGRGLAIGSHCSISAGVQIYTHNTVRHSVSLGREPIAHKPTKIGNGVYIGPNAVISMGVEIGDSVIVGAMSFVNRDIPARKKVWGCPARIVEDVVL